MSIYVYIISDRIQKYPNLKLSKTQFFQNQSNCIPSVEFSPKTIGLKGGISTQGSVRFRQSTQNLGEFQIDYTNPK